MKWMTVSAVLLLTATLSGCVNEADDLNPGPEVSGFTAVYRPDEWSDRRWELKPPVTIMDRDFQHRTAYPLVHSFANESDPRETVYYLDGDLRVVREDRRCSWQELEDECTHASVSYERQGALPPLGFFWPRHLDQNNGVLEYSLWLSNHTVEPDWIESEEGDSLIVPDDALPTEGNFGIPGEYRYPPGSLFPEKIEQPKGWDWELISFEEGEPLPPVDVWPKSTRLPQGEDRVDRMFPGEGEDPYGFDSPPLEVLDWLIENDAEAAEKLEDGCVKRYEYQPPFPSGSEPVPLPVELPTLSRSIFHKISIHTEDGEATEWTVRHKKDLLGEQYQVQKKEDIEARSSPCSELDVSPAPLLTMKEGMETMGRIEVSAHEEKMNFVYRFGPFRFGNEGFPSPPESGWDAYSLFYIPDYVDINQFVFTYVAYHITLSAASQYLEFLRFHPDDIEQMDQP